MINKQELGQYFTTHNDLKEKVYEFIKNDSKHILEPSIGRGDLIHFIQNKIINVSFDMFEIDNSINLLDNIDKNKVIYGDFMKQNIISKYKTIIGNPPYIRTKKGNLYIDFTEKCYNLLEENGELIFIVPSDFFKLTSASKLLNKMMLYGTFTDIFHPHNENMFENASIDILIFRYCKNELLEKKVLYNNQLLYIINNKGLITFQEKENKDNIIFQDYFDIYVGIVSGKDEIYKNNELGNIDVLNGENKYDKFIYIEEYPSSNEKINEYLLKNKDELMKRRIKKFNEKNWFEWGAPRNINVMKKYKGQECIYIYNLTRKSEVSFVGKVDYFGGNLIMLKPKKKCNLDKIVMFINSKLFKDNFIFSGRFKIGHRQISNSNIPKEYLYMNIF